MRQTREGEPDDPQFNELSTQFFEEQPCVQQTGQNPLRDSFYSPLILISARRVYSEGPEDVVERVGAGT